MAEVSGLAREWFSARRGELNARFRMAQHRHPRLDAPGTLELIGRILPPLTDEHANFDPLLNQIYDLVLLHSGRGLFAGTDAPLRVLFERVFPLIKPRLLEQPRSLPSALSNAVENLGKQGLRFATTLGDAAPALSSAEAVRNAGVLLAWRLGEARLRQPALNCAQQLPDAVVHRLLQLEPWPVAAARVATASLRGDAWFLPQERVSNVTLSRALHAEESVREKVLSELARRPTEIATRWVPRDSLGAFAGFDGDFLDLPELTAAADGESRHRFHVKCGDGFYRIDADVFGCVCKPEHGFDAPVQPAAAGRGRVAGDAVRKNARIVRGGAETAINGIDRIATYRFAEDMVFVTLPDSFRVRVLTSARAAL